MKGVHFDCYYSARIDSVLPTPSFSPFLLMIAGVTHHQQHGVESDTPLQNT
jgi:hypothetical protein